MNLANFAHTGDPTYVAPSNPIPPVPRIVLADEGRLDGLILALGILAATVMSRRRAERLQMDYGAMATEVKAAWAARGDVLIRQRGAAEEEERERRERAATR